MYCQQCGLKLPDGAEVCPVCKTPAGYDPGPEYYASHKDKQKKTEKNVAEAATGSRTSSKGKKGLVIGVAAVIVCLAVAFGAWFVLSRVIPEKKYKEAIKAHDEGRVTDAAEMMDRLSGYKDSEVLAADYYFEAEKYDEAAERYGAIAKDSFDAALKYVKSVWYIDGYEKAADAVKEVGGDEVSKLAAKFDVWVVSKSEVNDVVRFGTYEQDGDLKNGAEDLQWRVIAREEGRVMLWTESVIDYQLFHDGSRVCDFESYEYASWDKSSLRLWLNSTCFEDMFSDEEAEYVIETEHATSDCGGENVFETEDRLFPISVEEYDGVKDKLTEETLLQKDTTYAEKISGDAGEVNSCFTRNCDKFFEIIIMIPAKSEVAYSPLVIDPESGNTVSAEYSGAPGGVRPCVWIDVSGCSD